MANGDIIFNWGLANRALPGRTVDNQTVALRASSRGELITSPLDRFGMADEGSYFIFHNITNDASTTLAGHAAPVLADADVTMTKPLIFMRNSDAVTEQKRYYLDYIEIEVVTAGATGTQACWAAQLDTGTTRYASGTVETATVVNPNMQSTASGTSLVTFMGPVVTGAESASVRNLGFGTLRPSIEIAGDKKVFLFGRDPLAVSAAAAAAVREQIVNLPPVVLGPTDQFLLALHSQASQNAAGIYKIRGAYWYR